MSHSIANLRDVKDQAADFGLSEIQEARFAREDVGAESTGFSYHVIHPERRQAFGHRHEEAEEVYVAIRGSGRARLDDEGAARGR